MKDDGVQQTIKLYEKRKYARKSAENYGDHVRYVLLSVIAFLPPYFSHKKICYPQQSQIANVLISM